MHRLVPAMLFHFLLISSAQAQTAADINATIDGVLGDHEPYAEAFAAIQTAVADYEAEAVARWVAYPFSASIDGETHAIAGAEDFVMHYDEIVTEEVRETVTNQRYEDLFVNAEGVMLGNGQMWLNGVCSDDGCSETDVRIVAIRDIYDN